MSAADDSAEALIFWAMAALSSAHRVLDRDLGGCPLPASTSSSFTRQTDAALMVLALRNVLRAANWTGRNLHPTAREDVHAVLRQFDTYIPDLVNARDALEHFDEYAVGSGRLQRTHPGAFKFAIV